METIETYLKNRFNYFDKELNKISSRLELKSAKLAHDKIEFYKSELGFSEDEIAKIIKKHPEFLSLSIEPSSPTCVQNKIKFYMDTFDFTKEEVAKMVRTSPTLLYYDVVNDNPKSVKTKIKFYIEELGFSKLKLGTAIKNLPALLDYDIESVRQKVKFYQTSLEISKEKATEMIRRATPLLCLDVHSNAPTGAKAKLAKFEEVGFPKSLIVQHPMLLGIPANSIKIRIMLKGISLGNTNGKEGLMFNEQKIYRRAQHISQNQNLPKGTIYYANKHFEKVSCTTDKKLAEQYSLTREAALEIEKNYNNSNLPPLHLDDIELSQYHTSQNEEQ